MADTGLVLGVDIGGTNTDLGLVDREGRCLAQGTLPTHAQEPARAFFPRLARAARGLLDGREPCAIGVGAPNGNALRCSIEDPPNLAWGRIDLGAALAPWFSAPVAADNDANAAALGELRFGAARGMSDVIVITLGTGLGSGLIVDGRLLRGSTGFAGEIGHVTVDPAGRLCGCGRRGCLETYASATGLVTTLRDGLATREAPSALRDLGSTALTAEAIHRAALAGDALALEAFAFTGDLLGRALADSVAHTSPEAIFLLGGLARAGDLLFEPVRRSLEAHLFAPFRGTAAVLASGIAGNAAVLGAAALGWDLLDTSR